MSVRISEVVEMRRQTIFMLAIVVSALAACSDSSDRDATKAADNPAATTVDKNPQVDRDPTPETGTGGQSPATSPDGTTK